VPGQDDYRGTQPQDLGARRDERQEAQRRGDLAEPGEVVLDEERAAEAERLGLDVVVDDSRNPTPLSTSGPPRFACALPKSPNRISSLLVWPGAGRRGDDTTR
jgi:hypothetical protein